MTRPRLTNQWRAGLLIALGLFLVSRLLTLTAFPIFNDEANSLQYAQKMHEDWQANKFISMHGEFNDWKPPLQYWMAAPVIGWGNDPLVAGRAVALLASIAGLFGFYLFSKELFTEREGVFAALLYVLCPPVLFHNNQFTAETFLFSTGPFLYWALLKAMRPNKPDWAWAMFAVLPGTALLLFKQSGFLLLAVSILLPFARLHRKEGIVNGPAHGVLRSRAIHEWNWKQFTLSISLVIAVITCSHFAANALLPSEFNVTRQRFNGRWVMSFRELLHLPFGIWRTNLSEVADYIGSYYSWVAALFFGGFIWFALQRKNFAELTLASMCLAGGSGITFLLLGFNEYLFNTAIIAVFLPLLARTGVRLYDFAYQEKKGVFRHAFLLFTGFALVYWGYQDLLMGLSPGKYIERSTNWAVSNYLKSWSTGFGVKEIVAMLEREKARGIVFTDPQWGNPGTALEVYRAKRFPNLRIVPISREFLDASESKKLTAAARKMEPTHLAIFSADRSGPRQHWLGNVEREMCETRTEIRAYPSQMAIIVCRF